eukprot:g68230.t1
MSDRLGREIVQAIVRWSPTPRPPRHPQPPPCTTPDQKKTVEIVSRTKQGSSQEAEKIRRTKKAVEGQQTRSTGQKGSRGAADKVRWTKKAVEGQQTRSGDKKAVDGQ